MEMAEFAAIRGKPYLIALPFAEAEVDGRPAEIPYLDSDSWSRFFLVRLELTTADGNWSKFVPGIFARGRIYVIIEEDIFIGLDSDQYLRARLALHSRDLPATGVVKFNGATEFAIRLDSD